ncbi:MAG TPA: HAMP domain-containing sensor histidine kinase [Terriglobales bacterium]|nr:HAMP domain-containing sensor histidine kinase [Terriglobales bacterium]
MRIRGRRRRVAGFIVLGACLVALAAALNVGWIVVNSREGVLLILGILLFPLIIAGLVLNTIFLVREIRRNEQHNAFINAVTHELKTPVASIRLYLQTLQAREVEAAQRQEFYKVMLADSDRLLTTVEQILRTGRAGHARRTLARQRLDLAQLAREAATQVGQRYDLDGGGIVCRGEPAAGTAMVSGDADELRAALANLFDNAVKYSAPGGEGGTGPEVSWELEPDEGFWQLRVHDRGMGIPGSELKAIFKRFYRVPSQGGQVSGTGLGLFIVHSVARRHGGRVWADSAGPGAGSTFTMRLPAARPPLAAGSRA